MNVLPPFVSSRCEVVHYNTCIYRLNKYESVEIFPSPTRGVLFPVQIEFVAPVLASWINRSLQSDTNYVRCQLPLIILQYRDRGLAIAALVRTPTCTIWLLHLNPYFSVGIAVRRHDSQFVQRVWYITV